jgi:hypothetical protein
MASTSVKAIVLALSTFAAVGNSAAVEKRSDVPAGYYVPAYYPAPFGGWTDGWAKSYEKAKALVDKMTLAEKTNITAGTGIYMGKNALRSPCLYLLTNIVCRVSLTKT